MSYPHILTTRNITIFANGQPYTIDSSQPNFQAVTEAIKAGDWDLALDLIDIKTAAAKWSDNEFMISEEEVTYKGERLPPVMEQRIIEFWTEGLPFKPILEFFRRLEKNPSRNSVQQLYKFLEHGFMPIDDEGYFYGYKAIRHDWKDCYSGTYDNSVGQKPSVPRNQVDDDPNVGCSYGFHVGSLAYASSFRPSNGRIVYVRVDPANCVAVPHDCNFQKLRCSEYEVMSEYTGALPNTYVTRNEMADPKAFDVEEDEPDEWIFDDDEDDSWFA